LTLLKMFMMFIHIGAGVMWVGGLAYLRFIVLPTLSSAAPTVRGPIMVELGPRTVRYMLRLAEITIVTGILSIFLANRISSLDQLFITSWGGVIFFGLAGTLVIYIMGQAVTRPTTMRIAETLQAVAAGTPPANAPALLEALANKQRNMLTLQLAIATVVILTMAVARFS